MHKVLVIQRRPGRAGRWPLSCVGTYLVHGVWERPPLSKMLSRLAVLSRYTGVHVARQAGISRLAQASVPLAFAHVSQRTGLTAYQGFASSAVQQWEARGRGGDRDSRPSRPRREFTPREPMPPSERLYVGNITDLNRVEVSAFIQQQPGLITLHDGMFYAFACSDNLRGLMSATLRQNFTKMGRGEILSTLPSSPLLKP